MEKMIAVAEKLETSQLIEVIKEMYEDYSIPESAITASMAVLVKRIPEKDFIAFCDSL